MASEELTLETRGKIAIITINKPKKLNSMNRENYFRLNMLMREVAEMPNISVTILTGKGRFFSAGADVTAARPAPAGQSKASMREEILRGFGSGNMEITRTFYTHPKVLVAALNGPAVGLSAALLGWADFIYAAPHTYLLTPFSGLGLVAEGGASYGLVQRLGVSVANEALIQSRRIDCEKLVRCGFVNEVFKGKDESDSDGFMKQVLAEVEDRFGDHLNQGSMAKIKELIRAPHMDQIEAQGVREIMEGMNRFVLGIPQKEFQALASGKKRHKL